MYVMIKSILLIAVKKAKIMKKSYFFKESKFI